MMLDPQEEDRALALWLDRVAPPPLSADFAARVLAARREATPRQAAPRRGLRRPWLRRSLIASLAVGVMSAAAAATMMFGPVTPRTPIIGALVAQMQVLVRPSPPASPRIVPRKVMAKPVATPALVEPVTGLPRLGVERRIARIERRAERRRAAGLAPHAMRRERFEERLRRLPPEARAALIARRAARREMRLARWRAQRRARFDRD